MARLFAREERRLAAIGILSGILTAALVIVVWFRGVGVGPALQPTPGAAPARDPFVGALREQVTERLAAHKVSTRPLRGVLRVTARDVAWNVPGTAERFARAAVVSAEVNVDAANRGDIVLGTVRVQEPRITLRSNGRTWNYERPLAGLLEDGGRAGPARVFRLQALLIERGTVVVDLPEQDFTLEGVTARIGNSQFAGPGLAAPRMQVVSASASLKRAGEEPVALAAERGELRFPNRVTEFDFTAVTVAGTRIEALEGDWNAASPGYGVTATGRVPSVQFADIRFIAPDRIPEEGSASFRFAIAPLDGDGTAVRLTELAAVSGSSRVGGSLAAEVFPGRMAVERVDLRLEPVSLALVEQFMGRSLPYAGTLTGTLTGPGNDIRVDVVANLSADGVAERFSTRLLGGVGLTRAGIELRDLRAELQRVPLAALRPIAPGLPLSGFVSGTVALNGSPKTTPLRLDVRLEMGTGLATVAGTLDLTGNVPRYDVDGRLVGIDLQSVLEPGRVPPVLLTARFAVAGSGFDPAAMDARVRLNGGFSGWRSEPGDTVLAVARIAGGSVQVDTLVAALATADVNAAGRWRFIEPISGAVTYRLAVSSLEPFGPYLPAIGDSVATGALRAEGTVSGPLGALRLAGKLDGENLRVGQYGATRLESTYTVAFTGALPEVDLQFTGTEITTPTIGDYRSLVATMRLVTPVFNLDVRGDRTAGGQIAVVAEGTIPREGSRTINLNRAFFDLQEGRWELSRSARITWGGDAGIRVADLDLRNAQTSGRVALDGVVYPFARLDARVQVSDLPLEQVADLLGRDTAAVSGRLWADLTIRPPAASPDIDGTFRLEQAVVSGVRFTQLEGELDYSNGVGRTRLIAAFDSAAGKIEVNGTLPLRIAFADSLQFGFADTGPLDATLRAERVSLRPIGAFVPRVRELTGVIDGTVVLAGTASDPRLDGELALTGGSVRVPDLNQHFDSIGGVLAFEGRRAAVRDFRMYRDGWARLNGTATFEQLNRPVLDLVADLDDFQPMGVDQHPDAAVTGRVTLDGELNALVLSGDVTIDDGYLTVPTIGRAFEDDYIDLLDPTPVTGLVREDPEAGNWLTNLRISNLRARFGEGAWFEAMEGATAQLAGELTINRAGDDLRVVGELEGERGTYTLVAGPIVRRFEIAHALVRFRGETELNPSIDITARRVLLDETGRRVEVDVQITGTMQNPRLALASADAPNIPESELLSYMLFGRPTFALGEDVTSTGTDLFETFSGGVAEVLGLELERALSADLGLQLDLFQVRFGQGLSGITTPTLVVGRQLTDDFFLTVESGLSALFGDDGATANTWAVRLEWAIDRRSSLQTGIEPVNRARRLRGIGAALPPAQGARQQLFFEYRRRWVY